MDNADFTCNIALFILVNNSVIILYFMYILDYIIIVLYI